MKKLVFILCLSVAGVFAQDYPDQSPIIVGKQTDDTDYSNPYPKCVNHIGWYSGFNSTGNYNNFFGFGAGYSNTTGEKNNFIGFNAGYSNTTASENNFIGYEAGYSNSTGNKNVFAGFKAGHANTIGAGNNFIGYAAGLANTTGNDNSFTGYYSGADNTTGSSNTFVGYGSGRKNTTGSGNVFIGHKAGYNETGSNKLYIANSETNTPLVHGDFNAKTLSVNGELTVDKAKSKVYDMYNTHANYPNGMHTSALAQYNRVSLALMTPGNYFRIEDWSGGLPPKSLFTVLLNGNTSIDKGNFSLTQGQASKPGGGDWATASDARLKQDVMPFTDGLEVLQKVHPVRFRYNGKANMPADKEYIGIIAQQMQKAAPYTIGNFTHKDKEGNETEYLNYDGTALNYILVNAVKEQQQLIEAQQKEIANLKEMVYGLVSASKKASDAGEFHAAVGEK